MGKGSRPLVTGLRRLQWVRIDLTASPAKAELVGIGHRQPVRRPISLHRAVQLRDAGVPTLVSRTDGG